MAESLVFVESARIETTDYNWVNPLRPATDDECEQMILNAIKSPSMTAAQAQKYSLESLPENLTIEKVKKGQEDSKNGNVNSKTEAKKKLNKWM